jgi:hypothetical protein
MVRKKSVPSEGFEAIGSELPPMTLFSVAPPAGLSPDAIPEHYDGSQWEGRDEPVSDVPPMVLFQVSPSSTR